MTFKNKFASVEFKPNSKLFLIQKKRVVETQLGCSNTGNLAVNCFVYRLRKCSETSVTLSYIQGMPLQQRRIIYPCEFLSYFRCSSI